MSAAAARIAPFLEPAPRSRHRGARAPCPSRPRSVYWLEGNIQSILPITSGFEDATEALGWDLTTLTYDPADPQGPGRRCSRPSTPAPTTSPSRARPSRRSGGPRGRQGGGIPVIELYSRTRSVPRRTASTPTSAAPTARPQPEPRRLRSSPTPGRRQRAVREHPRLRDPQTPSDDDRAVRRQLPDCTSTSSTTIADLTGGRCLAVVSALQTNPDIEYVFVSIGDLATGLPEALASAGMAACQDHRRRPEPRAAAVAGRRHRRSPGCRCPGSAAWPAGRRHGPLEPGLEIDQVDEVLPTSRSSRPTTSDAPAADYAGPGVTRTSSRPYGGCS